MKILLLLLSLLRPISEEQLTAIEYYKELQFRCVPKTLKDSTIKVIYKDSTYIMRHDMNDLPWVTEKATAN